MITEQYATDIINYLAGTDDQTINPSIEGICVYDDNHGNRCVVGQILHDNGIDTTHLPSESIKTVAARGLPIQIEPEALQLLSTLQKYADSIYKTGDPPRFQHKTWGEAAQQTLEAYSSPAKLK